MTPGNAIGIFEIETAATVVMIDFAGLRCADQPSREATFRELGKDFVELLFATRKA